MRLERLPVWRQDAAFTYTVEQLRVNADFQLTNAFAYRGLGDVQLFGGQRK
jgi:hypothetical protein